MLLQLCPSREISHSMCIQRNYGRVIRSVFIALVIAD